MPGIDLNYFIRQANKLTEKIEQRKKELAEETVEAQAGDGRVTVVANCIQEVRSIKIDKSLIVADDEQSRLLFSNVVRTLRELKLVTVAEGIETQEQLQAARRAGVSMVQGHIVCEAVPMEELLRRVGPDGTDLAASLG